MRRPRRGDHDFCDEIEAHLQLEADRLASEGMSPEEALAAARRAFGNVTRARERFYESTRWMWCVNLKDDLRYALRVLRKTPTFTLTAVLVLALGGGANTAVFSFVSSLLLRPLPFPGQDRLVSIREAKQSQGFRIQMVSPGDFLELRQSATAFAHLSAYAFGEFTLTGAKEPSSVFGLVVSSGFFEALQVRAAHGRTFLPEEVDGAHAGVVVISHGLWQRQFGGDPAIVGRKVSLDDRPRIVIGVMPPDFDYPFPAVELWSPLVLSHDARFDHHHRYLAVVGRLKPEASRNMAQGEISAIARRLEAEHKDTNAGRGLRVVPLHDQMGDLSRPFLLLLQAAAIVVLVVGCANVANLQLSQAARRTQEMGLRSALGASRSRLVRMMLAESLVLSTLGASLGIPLAYWGVHALQARVPASTVRYVPGWSQIAVDSHVLLFALGITVVCGTSFALFTALQTSRFDLVDSLRDGGAGVGQHLGKARLRQVLVAAEIAMAVVLTIAAVHTTQGFRALFAAYNAFSPGSVLTARLWLPPHRYPTPARINSLYDRLLAAAQRLPGVSNAALTSILPGSIRYSLPWFIEVEGQSDQVRSGDSLADVQIISPDYFRTVLIPIRQGRAFRADDREANPPAAVVNRTFAARHLQGQDAIGRRIRIPAWTAQWRSIVGVVGDVRQNWSDPAPRPTMYLPSAQEPRSQSYLMIRGAGDPSSLLPALRRELERIDPSLPLLEAKPLERVIHESAAPMAVASRSMRVFGEIALSLALLGVYAVMSHAVTQRQREFAIRMALGAQPNSVLGLLLRHTLLLTLIGISLGIGAAVVVVRAMASLLYGLTATSLSVLVLVPAAVCAAALVAGYLPARASIRLDPMHILRHE